METLFAPLKTWLAPYPPWVYSLAAAGVLLLAAFAVNLLTRYILVRGLRKILKALPAGDAEEHDFRGAIVSRLANIVPALVLSCGASVIPDVHDTLETIIRNVCNAFIVLTSALALARMLDLIELLYRRRPDAATKPIKGYLQLLKIFLTIVAVILMIAMLINRNPLILLSGLGAMAAVLMLIFQDTLLSLVASIQLGTNDMVRIGDWIEMPQNNINGIVTDISLDVVKVQNFDNTIVTVPPYTLISNSFVNWRGMSESGGRRIMREYTLKLNYIKPCTPEFLERMKQFDPDLGDFISAKQRQAAEGKVANTENPEGLVNGTIDTNLGLLRAYMTLYLQRHPAISKELLVMIRTLAPTENGLPVQIYCFSANKNWPSYESIQSEIMEHFVSVLPAFELYPYQSADARDAILGSYIESSKVDPATLEGIPWHTVRQEETNKSAPQK